jgi:tetratricopeptide (TPR) repeat protein
LPVVRFVVSDTGELQMSNRIHPFARWLIFAGVFFASGALARSAVRHALAVHWAASSNPESLLRAAETESTNPDLWYQLGRYRQFDLRNSNLPLAIAYYQRAISLSPGSAAYWMDLADVYEASGNLSAAEESFRTARRTYPISAQTAWRYGNFLLRHGRIAEGFAEIHNAVVTDSKLAKLAVSRCWRISQDINAILGNALPDQQDDNWAAIQFFVETRESVPAMAVWRRIAAHHQNFPVSNTFPLLDMLLETGGVAEAQTVWSQSLSAAGVEAKTDSGGSLIWNGGFETEPLNGGFDWRIAPTAGVRMRWDNEIFHSGERSLRVDFDGSTNINFEHVWQYVPVQPGTRYRFAAFLRIEGLSTDSGIRFEIRDVSRPGNPSSFTPNFVGTSGWSEQVAEFTTAPDTKLLKIILRRTPSEKFANKIRGTAWIDDVALVPVDHHPESAR